MQILPQFIIIILYSFIFSSSEEVISTWKNGEKKTVHIYDSKNFLYQEKNFKDNKKHGRYIDYHSPEIPAKNDSLFQLYKENPKEYPTQPRKIMYYKNDVKDSIYIEFDSNGEMRLQGNYKQGKKDGEWIRDPQGKYEKKRTYKDGILDGEHCDVRGGIQEKGNYKDGKKDGFWTENNAGVSEGNYINGKKEGEWIRYFSHTTQKQRRKSNYKNGELHGEFIIYDVHDGIDEKGNYENGNKVGFWIESEYAGNDFSEGNYIDGKKEGKWVTYYLRKNYNNINIKILKSEFNYKDDKLHGKYIEYGNIIFKSHSYENQIIIEGNYKDGNKVGFWKEKTSEGNYKQDKKEGEWITYNTSYSESIERSIVKKSFYTTMMLDWYPPSHYSRKNGEKGRQSFESILINEQLYYYNGVLREELKFKLNDSVSKYGGYGDGTGISHSIFVYYENGNIKSESNYIKGKIGYKSMGTKHGIWKEYCNDGNISAQFNYKEGKIIGYFYNTQNYACVFNQNNNFGRVKEPLDTTIKKIEMSDRDNFIFMKDLAFKSNYSHNGRWGRHVIYEGFCDEDGTPMEITGYIGSTRILKQTITKLDTTDNSEKRFKYKSLMDNKIMEEGIISSPPTVSYNDIYITENQKQSWKEYGKEGGILIETIYDNQRIKTKIFYDKQGIEIGRLDGNHHSELNGRFIKYYRDSYNNLYTTHDLIHIVGQYTDGKQIGEWIHYGYKFINPDSTTLDPNSRKIIFKANLNDSLRDGQWITNYPISRKNKLSFYKGIDPSKAMTNTSALRTKAGAYKLNGIARGDFMGDRHSYWGPAGSNEFDWSPNSFSYIILSGEYKDNKQEGLWQAIINSSDIVLEEANYKNGVLDGGMIYYYENGNKNFEGNYLQGERTGEWIYYYENSSIKAKGKIEKGKPDGDWIVYNKDGTIQKDEEKWRFFK